MQIDHVMNVYMQVWAISHGTNDVQRTSKKALDSTSPEQPQPVRTQQILFRAKDPKRPASMATERKTSEL